VGLGDGATADAVGAGLALGFGDGVGAAQATATTAAMAIEDAARTPALEILIMASHLCLPSIMPAAAKSRDVWESCDVPPGPPGTPAHQRDQFYTGFAAAHAESNAAMTVVRTSWHVTRFPTWRIR
jgi:hypothetical protein